MNLSGQSRIESLETSEHDHRTPADMDADIEFGQVEHSQPEQGLRPDQDKHFVVAMCGDVQESDLPIFVDMDVMRDMEAHARENTRVELGGVMLGRQHVDDEGKPFVIITDSLRAKHYEATKGSFKFTHDTWNQITRERNEYHSELELVGWYHTHPGWGVFLSGMDLFICNNFFSRPLDVALVIDPCAGDRGWFQWTPVNDTRQTPGFFLMTNRHRQTELNYFSEIFSDQNPRFHDPRFQQASFGDHGIQQGEDMVNVIDNRRPVFELAIVSMLFLQMVLVAIFGYRFLGTPSSEPSDELAARLTAAETQFQQIAENRNRSIREQAFQDVLGFIVDRETGTQGLVAKYSDIAVKNQELTDNLVGQRARIELAEKDNSSLNYELAAERDRAEKLTEDLAAAQKSMSQIRKLNNDLTAQLDGEETAESISSVLPAWLMYTVGGIGLFFLGIMGGSWFTRRQLNDEYVEYSQSGSEVAQRPTDGKPESKTAN